MYKLVTYIYIIHMHKHHVERSLHVQQIRSALLEAVSTAGHEDLDMDIVIEPDG